MSQAGILSVSGVTPGVLLWKTITASQTAIVDQGYIAISPGGAIAILLPPVSAVGDQFAVTLDGATSWTITQGLGQQIRLANNQTTSGAGGSLASTQQGDTVWLVCSVANTRWNVIDVIGNITIV